MALIPEIISQPEVALTSKRGKSGAREFGAYAIVVSNGGVPIDERTSAELESLLGVSLSKILSQWPDFTGKAGELIELPVSLEEYSQLSRLFIVGAGSGQSPDLRKAGATLARKVKGKETKLGITLSASATELVAFSVALLLASYSWSLKSTQTSISPTFIIFKAEEEVLEYVRLLAQSVWNARDLIHTPSNIKTPLWMANQAKQMVAETGSRDLVVTVRAGNELKEFGGLRAVGGSSPNPGPRFIEVNYQPRGSHDWPHVVLVGKGITFDTGGVSLKRPYDTMTAMKSDMAGAAAVLSTVVSMAKLQPKLRVTALLMCAENAISATAQRPSDVITHFGGTTVEVINTDAEGRLVLADGLAYADVVLDADYIVDVATLTGAATLGLGRQYAAMYTRDENLARTLEEIGEVIGDRVWHMPLIDDYLNALESDVADFNHTAEKGHYSAGSVTAALFLEKFVGNRRWVHLDIAGTGRSETDAGEYVKGGTGFGVRLLIQWLAHLNSVSP